MQHLDIAQKKRIEDYLTKKKKTRLTTKEYNEIVSNTTQANNKTYSQKNKYKYKFKFFVEKIDHDTYKFILLGKHISTNTYNNYASIGRRSAYKIAIKNAAYNYSLMNRRFLNEITPKIPFEKSILEPIAYNPNSREDDGCFVTIETLRDLLTNYNFIKDNKRKYLTQLPVKEVLSNEYKIELLLKRVS
jgi:hypothetical protein